jgi:hypothetical protein
MKSNTKPPHPPIHESLDKTREVLFGFAFVLNGRNFFFHTLYG